MEGWWIGMERVTSTLIHELNNIHIERRKIDTDPHQPRQQEENSLYCMHSISPFLKDGRNRKEEIRDTESKCAFTLRFPPHRPLHHTK